MQIGGKQAIKMFALEVIGASLSVLGEDVQMKIKLTELAEAFQKSDMLQGYVDIRNGKVVLYEEDDMERAFLMEEDWENYVLLPNLRDEVELSLKKDFLDSLENRNQQEGLRKCKTSIQFAHQLSVFALEDAWNIFRQEKYLSAAKEWCEENAVEWLNEE